MLVVLGLFVWEGVTGCGWCLGAGFLDEVGLSVGSEVIEEARQVILFSLPQVQVLSGPGVYIA